MTVPKVRQVLNLYAEKRTSNDAVIRALLEHDGWQMPLELFAASSPKGAALVAPRVVVVGQGLRAERGHVLLFTDDDTAQHAATHLGSLAAGLSGVDVMRRALALGERIIVNPGSPDADAYTIVLDERARGLLGLWIAAIDVEQRAARGPLDDPAVLRMLHDYGGYVTYFHKAQNSVVTIPNQGGLTNGAVLFTSPDSVHSFLAKLTRDVQAGLMRVPTDGATWFDLVVKGGGVDGVILNPLGPGKTVALPLEVCRKIAEL